MSTQSVLTRVLPTHAVIDMQEDAARTTLAEWYATDAAVRMNMITSLTGAASGADGTSNTLTNRVDRAILRVIRAAADVVVVGAASVRAEGYQLPARARLAIVTGSGRLDGHRFAASAADAPIVLCPADRLNAVRRATADFAAEVIPLPSVAEATVSPAAVVQALQAHGMARIVCEGGPTLASAFLRAGVVDEVCVTVAPTIDPVTTPFVSVRARARTAVRSHAVDGAGFSYLRLAVQR